MDAKLTTGWTVALTLLSLLVGTLFAEPLKKWVSDFGSDGLAGSYAMPEVVRDRLKNSVETRQNASGISVDDVPASVSAEIFGTIRLHLDGRGGAYSSFFDFIDVRGSYRFTSEDVLEIKLAPENPKELRIAIESEAMRRWPHVRKWRVEDISVPFKLRVSPRRDRLSLVSFSGSEARFVDEFYLSKG